MSTKRSLGLAALCLLVALMIFGVYWRTSEHIASAAVMPLDDAYIHFQYARSIAEGRPYVYNPGQDPTSGATSLLHPYLLAIGYALNFHGLTLGLWAMMLGGVLLAWSMRVLIAITWKIGLPLWVGVLTAFLFGLNGATSWHYMSGMETGLAITAVLTVFAALLTDHPRWIALSTTLLALVRPELSIAALIVILAYFVRAFFKRQSVQPLLVFAFPFAAIALQPMLNWLITGSISASGNQAKSIFGVVPFDWQIATERVFDSFLRLWREWFTTTDYLPLVVPPLALIGFALLLADRQRHWIGLTLALMFLVVTGAISTLDTAFWHFKRYQMPMIALFFPLALIGLHRLWILIETRQQSAYWRWPRLVVALMIAVSMGNVVRSGREFLRLYAVNVENVVAQPLPMAQWINVYTDANAVIAVHDVGMMRYIGERTTLDMVGLTTPQAADYWRNGPGAVGEFLLAARPDYVAAYTTARGLNYLVETPLYGELFKGFTATYDPADNVALGAEFQGIYRVDWEILDAEQRSRPLQPSILPYLDELITEINVADLASEAEADYTWASNPVLSGFATEFYTFDYIACDLDPCFVTDGGRRITEWEAFTISDPPPSTDFILVTRLHPASRATLNVMVNDVAIATREVIEQPGQWLEIATRIPATNAEQLHIRIETNGVYMPYRHWLYTAEAVQLPDDRVLATYQGGAIELTQADLVITGRQLELSLTWRTDGTASGNYKAFVHVYNGEINREPLAQRDFYSGGGTLPPGNWLQGMISDRIMVDLGHLEAGIYTVAIGFYDPQTFTRLAPVPIRESWMVDADRLFIGEIEIK